MSLGSGDQNWKTVPPLASGHLNERSAPGDTGSPCSIFRKDSRNPEDREEKKGRDRQDTHTQREEKRLVKEVDTGAGQHLQALKHGVWSLEEKAVEHVCPFFPAP